MKKSDIVQSILHDRHHPARYKESSKAFAPTNIALCKYWGKREQELNLPMTSSLSISLADRGALVELKFIDQEKDSITLNNLRIDSSAQFSQRLIHFLNLFRLTEHETFSINIETNVPIAAGLASSACGFASIVKGLNGLYGWELAPKELSILARLGSGSACRSIWSGFVEWHAGARHDGSDSHGELLAEIWPEFCVGLVILNDKEKGISSREAMQRTILTSSLYSAWPAKVNSDLVSLKQAIAIRDFNMLGKAAESNALAMHATMITAWPPINYSLPDTLIVMQKIWKLRQEGLAVYFTQDAGPNLKLLFLEKDRETLLSHFPDLEVIQPFKKL